MIDNLNIERTILASLLNSEMDIEFNAAYFLDPFHKKLAKAINRFKKLDEYVDFEIIRNSFIADNAWSFNEDEKLIYLMTYTTPFASNRVVASYMKLLKESYFNSLDKRLSI